MGTERAVRGWGGETIAGAFIRWLLEQGLSQSEISRRTGVSQAWLSRTSLGSGARIPNPEFVGRLAQEFPEQWRTWRLSHPAVDKELARLFGWAYPLSAQPRPADPALAQAIEHLTVVASGPYRRQVFRELRLYAEHTRSAEGRARRPRGATAPTLLRTPRAPGRKRR